MKKIRTSFWVFLMLTSCALLLAGCGKTKASLAATGTASAANAATATASAAAYMAKLQTNMAEALTNRPQQTELANPGTPCGAVLSRPLSGTGPSVCAFQATFYPASKETVYRVYVFDTNNPYTAITFTWSNSNPCGKFGGNVSGDPGSVIWLHPDSNKPGACPEQAVHPGTITVDIKAPDGEVTCTYPNGSAPGNDVQCVNH